MVRPCRRIIVQYCRSLVITAVMEMIVNLTDLRRRAAFNRINCRQYTPWTGRLASGYDSFSPSPPQLVIASTMGKSCYLRTDRAPAIVLRALQRQPTDREVN